MDEEKMNRFWRKVTLIALPAIAGLYCLSYVLNSYNGGYDLTPEIDGAVKYSTNRGGMGLPVAILWQPYLGYYSGSEVDFWGKIFVPCIALDRAFIHKTHYLTDEDTFKWIDWRLPASSVHPKWRSKFVEARKLLQDKREKEK